MDGDGHHAHEGRRQRDLASGRGSPLRSAYFTTHGGIAYATLMETVYIACFRPFVSLRGLFGSQYFT